MPDKNSRGDYRDIVSRRKFVSLAGATGAAAVAGCIGGDGDDGSDASAPFAYDQEDITFQTYGTAAPPSDFRFNVTAGWPIPHAQFGMYEDWAKYYIEADEWQPHLLTDWEHGDGEMVLTMSEDYTWSSGTPVTADDLVMQLEIQRNVGDVAWDVITDAEATGEYELTLSYEPDTNTRLVDYAILQKSAAFAPSIWEDADWESAGSVTISDPVSSGPLVVDSVSDSLLETSIRDDHQRSDHYNWNGYDQGYRGDNQAGQQSFIAGEVDGVHSQFVGPDQLENFPDSVREFRIPGAFGMGIWPVHTTEPWNSREVRQALYYSIDRGAVIDTVGSSTKISHHPVPTGLTWATVEQYLGSEEPGEPFNLYARNTDQVESLLSDAGTSFGDVGTISLTFPSGWSDWSIAAENVIEQLNSAGWDCEGDPRSSGPGTYAGTNLDETEIELAVDQHTAGGSPHMNEPYFSFRYILNNRTRWNEGHFAGYDPSEPTEISSGEVVPEDLLADLVTASGDEREELITQLAEVVNKDVPVLYVMEKYEQSFIDTRRFDIPEESQEFDVFWPLWWLPMVDETLETAGEEATEGLMKARTN